MNPDEYVTLTPKQAAEILKEHNFTPTAQDLDKVKEIMLSEHGRYFPASEGFLEAYFDDTKVLLKNNQYKTVLEVAYSEIVAVGKTSPNAMFIRYIKGSIEWTVITGGLDKNQMKPFFDWLDRK